MFYPTRRENPSLLVAIDPSASMSPDEQTEIARHLNVLSDLVRMTIVECDVRIQRVYRFRGTIDRAAGRGGTDLRPVFEPQFFRDHRPDGVIYFIDGLGPYPESDPGVKTLWVLANPVEFGCPWGEGDTHQIGPVRGANGRFELKRSIGPSADLLLLDRTPLAGCLML